MNIPELNDSKKDFQLERMILFTDAVFAIAITLLIIEIKAPELHHYKNHAQALFPLIPKFVGFAVSFFVIAIYWRSHHRIFGYLHNYDDKLITLNFFFLFLIVCLPFSSALSSENYGESISTIIYFINLILVGIINFLLLKHIHISKKNISDLKENSLLYQYYKARSLAVPAIFLVCLIVDLYFNGFGRPMLILIWPVMAFISNHFKKKQKA